jgi:homospermidine synthase
MKKPLLAKFLGPIVIVGYGSIARAFLPLLKRHIEINTDQITIVAPDLSAPVDQLVAASALICLPLTPENFVQVLGPLLSRRQGGVLVNLAIDVCSADLLELANRHDWHYLDTAIEQWPDPSEGGERLTDYALREAVLDIGRVSSTSRTSVVCCGANPGSVSWFVKIALLELASEFGQDIVEPSSREGWAKLMRRLGVKGLQIAEYDSQRAALPPSHGVIRNTWSVEAFLAESWQRAELGWGSHEKSLPPDAEFHSTGCRASIVLNRLGKDTIVRSWTPGHGEHLAYLLTHNESISIADYFTVKQHGQVVYRPTCFFGYRPCDEAVAGIKALSNQGGPSVSLQTSVLKAEDIYSGADELGVLLYGHQRGAYWFGSRLSNVEAQRLAPGQNATGMQVAAALLAGLVWLLENPGCGLVEADEMDFKRCIEIQKPYLGRFGGMFTNWTPDSTVAPNQRWQFSSMEVCGRGKGELELARLRQDDFVEA